MGPVAGAAAQAFFACDMRLKHDIDCLTDMNLVKDDSSRCSLLRKRTTG